MSETEPGTGGRHRPAATGPRGADPRSVEHAAAVRPRAGRPRRRPARRRRRLDGVLPRPRRARPARRHTGVQLGTADRRDPGQEGPAARTVDDAAAVRAGQRRLLGAPAASRQAHVGRVRCRWRGLVRHAGVRAEPDGHAQPRHDRTVRRPRRLAVAARRRPDADPLDHAAGVPARGLVEPGLPAAVCGAGAAVRGAAADVGDRPALVPVRGRGGTDGCTGRSSPGRLAVGEQVVLAWRDAGAPPGRPAPHGGSRGGLPADDRTDGVVRCSRGRWPWRWSWSSPAASARWRWAR